MSKKLVIGGGVEAVSNDLKQKFAGKQTSGYFYAGSKSKDSKEKEQC